MPFKKDLQFYFQVYLYVVYFVHFFYLSLKQFHNADTIAIHFFMDMVCTGWKIFLYYWCPVGVTSEHMSIALGFTSAHLPADEPQLLSSVQQQSKRQ